ncbi:MAG: hypothetical protein Q9171_003197 [Xanthocarpia ochracea]
MDFLDAPNPPVEIKLPLRDFEAPARTNLDQVAISEAEGDILPPTTQDLGNIDLPGHPSIESPDHQEQGYGAYENPPGAPMTEDPISERSDEDGTKGLPHDLPFGLAEVRHVVALEQYYRKRSLSQQYALESLTRTCGIYGRLIPCLDNAHLAIADCYQNGDSTGFAKIHQTCERLVDACRNQTMEPTIGDPEDNIDRSYALPVSWLERLPQDCQHVVVSLLSSLRTDDNFLADRLSSLSFSELIKVASRSVPSRRPQSIFQGLPRRSSIGFSQSPLRQENDLISDKLWNFHQGDPFFVLFHGVFGTACTQGAKEQRLKIQIWSTACARVITEARPGSDEFTISTLDAFFDSNVWSLKPQLETYIAKMLQKGAFLVDPVLKEPTNAKEPLEIRNANAVIATSNFFDQALKDLLGILLSSSSVNMLPDGLHTFICRTLGKIHNIEVRTRARHFIVSKWLISSILARALTNPQTYIVEFRKTAAPVLDLGMQSLVEQLLGRFDALPSEPGQKLPTLLQEPQSIGQIFMLSAHDVAGLLQALYPKLLDSTSSANPSTAGSSTLVSESLWHGHGDTLIAPSVSNMSLDGVSVSKPEPLQSWNTHPEPLDTGIDSGAAALPRNKGYPSRIPEDQLIRTYRYLTSSLQPLLAPNSGIALPDWEFFRTDSEGCVQRSSSNGKMLFGSPRFFDQQIDTVKMSDNSMKELRISIARLLTLQIPSSETTCDPSTMGGARSDEIRSGLDKLIQLAIDRASTGYRYQDLHFWWRAKELLREYQDSVHLLLQSIYDECQERIRASHDASREIDEHLYGLSSLQQSQNRRTACERRQRQAFRMKMWYISDVQHSSTYEDALHVTQALRAMADPSRSKHPTGVVNWARNRLRNVAGHDRTNAQTLDALTEPNEHSGISKLNDDQVERTTRWLTRNSVENFCRGEERIHRFCLEVQKCSNKLTGPTLLESPVLWSSPLFEQEKKAFSRKPQNTHEQHFQDVNRNITHTSDAHLRATLPTVVSQQRHGISQSGVNNYWIRPLEANGRAGIDSPRSKSTFNDSFAREPVRSLPYQTPFQTPDLAGLSDQSGQSQHFGNPHEARECFIADVRKGLYSLVLSDLGYLSWHSGTETDSWLRQNLLDENIILPAYGTAGPPQVAETHSQPRHERVHQNLVHPLKSLKLLLTAASAAQQDLTSRWHRQDKKELNSANSISEHTTHPKSDQSFPYRQSYKAILEQFSLSNDPQNKLLRLHELEQLASLSIQDSLTRTSSARIRSGNDRAVRTNSSHLKSMLVPRTKATSFEEVIANCTERRAGTMRFKNPAKTPSFSSDTGSFGTDEVVDTFLSIFRDPELRPATLFRDLQYIAALVPAQMLDRTPQGKAFWDVGLAALALKQELCDSMIVRATDITTYHISASSSSPTPPTALPAGVAHTTLRDAAELWIITAKEGSATAARELGLLYLTHPELLPRATLLPFSKPKEVFRSVGAKKEGSTVEEGRLDPVTFAVVFHWMEVAANGGDKDARDFLKGNGEWGFGR